MYATKCTENQHFPFAELSNENLFLARSNSINQLHSVIVECTASERKNSIQFNSLHSNTKLNCLSFFPSIAELLPDAIQSDCSKCSAAQKRNSKKVINFLRTRRPQDWKSLTDKYDPKGLFKQRLDAGLV